MKGYIRYNLCRFQVHFKKDVEDMLLCEWIVQGKDVDVVRRAIAENYVVRIAVGKSLSRLKNTI